jgi:hypothetical protein
LNGLIAIALRQAKAVLRIKPFLKNGAKISILRRNIFNPRADHAIYQSMSMTKR